MKKSVHHKNIDGEHLFSRGRTYLMRSSIEGKKTHHPYLSIFFQTYISFIAEFIFNKNDSLQ